ncbi:LysR family transcriptional regulator [Acidicapsa ligni]|uniref:LysR family transcriptional regulator n=1 Tax=Acidicapsa ligni TaxID=542300 RepID=UPI0021E01777|nr:LysR family transcriptional regulator [Acidicapsa ligni]
MADLEYLRAFLAIYRSGSVTKAAAYVHLSQPAVSGQLKSLEQQIGRTLFNRTPRGIVPTAAAHDLARSIAPHIDALESAGDSGAHGSEIEGTVQIGGPVEFLTQRVLPTLAPLVRLGLHLRVVLGETEQLLEAISKNDLDLAIVGQHKKVRNIDSELLYHEELVLVAAPSWLNHIPRKGEISVRHLDGIPLLVYSEEMPQVQEFWESVFEVEPDTRPGVIVSNLRALMTMAIAGAGMTVLPRYYCDLELRNGDLLELVEPRTPPASRLMLASTSRSQRIPRNRVVRDALLRAKVQW